MSTSVETSGESAIDWLKWIVVFALVGTGVFGNWYYQDWAVLYRVVSLLGLAIVALLVVVQTQKGRAAWELMKDARSEIRRVVWPTRQETLQTTMIVLVLILVFSLILWLLDSGLSWLVSTVIG
ncbi:MAG: preprotein translocase subunit SecE [Gammaproteobacteria bacterium]|nr:preprotein translocase subunit SecE [Gammaproteobacteria bacterium]